MFENRTYKRTFYSAPQSVTSLVAAFLEPGITVLAFVLISLAFDEPMTRPSLTLCLLVFALTFPGRNRFGDNAIAAAVDIVTSWVALLGILALCGYATRSMKYAHGAVDRGLGRHQGRALAGFVIRFAPLGGHRWRRRFGRQGGAGTRRERGGFLGLLR